MLSRDQIKKVVGGYVDIGDGDRGKYQKCCPKGNCSISQCSVCVFISEGSRANCSANNNVQVCDC